ncbi:MAG: phage tail protein [Magnetospirillum gryphiswaldense]|nr:phage tail protein [Magnetospirillum gryphiswaldense]
MTQQVDCFVGEIRPFAGQFVPVGWAFCNGAVLAVNDYQALFALIGTTYGGNGVTTFGLPDLRGRLAVGSGQGPGLTNRILGASGGVTTVTLTPAQMPAHTHTLQASTTAANNLAPGTNNTFGTVQDPMRLYIDTSQPMQSGSVAFGVNTISVEGGGSEHNNIMPGQTINFIIATDGMFPQF